MVSEAQTILVELSSDEAVRRLAEERELALKFWEMEMELTREQSEAKGQARSILKFLTARGIEPTASNAGWIGLTC